MRGLAHVYLSTGYSYPTVVLGLCLLLVGLRANDKSVVGIMAQEVTSVMYEVRHEVS